MSQQVQELIDKIKAEGVQAADQKAKEIEGAARATAQKMITDAKTQAKHIIADAQAQAQRTHESTEMALKQSARDTLLALRKEIEGVLQKVISKEIKDSLTPEHLVTIIAEIIKKSVEANLAENEIEITLNAKDLDKLKDGFMAKLQKAVKQPIRFKSSDNIASGFTISFDEGKSCFDFSNAALVEYLSTYLNAQVASLLKE
jgi:V/A-type H+-transporting ATPase subunit E